MAHREQDGTVRFEAQNLRVLAALVSDDDEYEYYRTIRRSHVPQLIEMLGARAGDDLRNLLAHAWSEDRSFELEAMFREAAFPVEFFSRQLPARRHEIPGRHRPRHGHLSVGRRPGRH